MALPQSAVEQLSRRPPASPGWFGQLLMFAATLFFISVVVYVGLVFGYKPYVNRDVRNLDEQIKRFALEIPAEDQKNTANFYTQLVNLRMLLDQHVNASKLFEWLEKYTVTNVYFSKLALTVPNRQLTLSGVARTMDDATSQLQIFQERTELDRFTFSTIRYDSVKNQWDFEVTLFFTPAFFATAVTQTAPAASSTPPAVAPPPPATSTGPPSRTITP